MHSKEFLLAAAQLPLVGRMGPAVDKTVQMSAAGAALAASASAKIERFNIESKTLCKLVWRRSSFFVQGMMFAGRPRRDPRV